MSTTTLPSPRKTSMDDIRLGVNAASALTVVACIAGLACTLSGQYQAWITPAPYLWIAAGSLVAFLAGVLLLPSMGLASFDTTKSICLCSSSALLMLGVFLLANSTHTGQLLSKSLRDNEATQKVAKQFAQELEASNDAAARRINELNEQIEGLKADDPKVQTLKAEIDALKATLAEQTKVLNTWKAVAEDLKKRADATALSGHPETSTNPSTSGPTNEKNVATDDDVNPDPDHDTGGVKGRGGQGEGGQGQGNDGKGQGNDGKGNNGKGNANNDGGGNRQDNGSGSSPEQFVSKLVMIALAAAMPELLPILKFLGLDLFSMGVREEDLPAIVDAVKKATKSGPNVNVDEILDMLKNTKNPQTASAALKRILSQKGIREQIGDKALQAITDAFAKRFVATGKRPNATPSVPSQAPNGNSRDEKSGRPKLRVA